MLRDAKLLRSKCLYMLKMHASGTIERYKVRLVGCGDRHVYHVDYTYTFSSVLDMVSGKVILAVSRTLGVPGQHGDVPSAYVKSKKEDDLEILLHIPHGMEIKKLLEKLRVQDERQLALKIKKGLYILKQSGRLWNLMLHEILISLVFNQCYTDTYLYTKTDSKTLVGIYADDILPMGTRLKKASDVFSDMQIDELKNLVVDTNFLGIVSNYNDEAGWAPTKKYYRRDAGNFVLAESAPVRVSIGGEGGDEESAFCRLMKVARQRDRACRRFSRWWAVHCR